ncbi:MAG: site-2 protease family protein [Candidatus Berkelbacteria bacterium]|nr:MAG: site-2 protease family protein [Candidatus Berkelbacteria bacterium]QQG51544.1 MAG: site-2 protease family protein [Candidatus Berkelbacteria bacterium]
MATTLIVFLVILSVLVYVHEFGHFLLAKLNGVKVLEFAFGFRPRLFFKKIGETEYAVNLIPLGGYVKLYGEGDGEKGPQSFRSKSIFQRFQVLVAGALMNLVLAWLILTGLFMTGFDPLMPGVGNNPFVTATQQVGVVRVVEGTPASSAGILAGDTITKVDGQAVASDQEFVALVNNKRGKELVLTLDRNGEQQLVTLTPRENPPPGQGMLGVAIRSTGQVRSSVLMAPVAGFYETGRIIGVSAQGIGNFAKNLFIRGKVSEDVTGIIGIGALTGVTRRLGFDYLVQLVAVVSIGLGVINLVPLLPLDGGHIAALGYEKLAGRPMSDRQLGALATVGLALVLLLFVVVTYKDIVRFDILGRFF